MEGAPERAHRRHRREREAVESDPFSDPDSYDPFPGSRYVLTVVIEGPENEVPGLAEKAGRIIRRHGGTTQPRTA
ncbi:MAG: hypothetical protein ACYC9Q_07780 [Bacillota bacterium]